MDVWENIKRIGAAAGVILALAGLSRLYVELGGPTLAWSQDVEKLESQQLDTAIEVFQQKQRSLTLQKGEVERSGGGTSREHGYISEELDETGRTLEALRQRKIDLAK